MHRLPFVLHALVLAALLSPLHADVKTGIGDKGDKPKKEKRDKKPLEFAPEVRDLTARFVAGGSVDIELGASVSSLTQLEFMIRQQPVYGTLSAVRPHPRDTNKAIVTYTHNSVDAPVNDQFTFACRISDGPISAPATVKLLGQKYEPVIGVQNVSSMGKVYLGGEGTVRFTVRNTGPAAFSSDLTWEAPWRGPPHLELKPGEATEVAVIFQPTNAGIFRLDRLLQPGQNGSRLLLYGECVRPLTVSPSRLKLTLNAKTGAREGTLTLANGLNTAQEIEFKLPPRLAPMSKLEVPANGQLKVQVSLPPQDVTAFRDEVAILTGDTKEMVTVDAEAKAAVLQLLKPAEGVLNLGSVPQSGEARGEVILKNNGGLPAVVQALPGAAAQITPSGEAIRIEAGAEGKFLVSLRGEQVGNLQTEVHIQGAGILLRVPVKVNVVPLVPQKPTFTAGGNNLVAPVENAPAAPAPSRDMEAEYAKAKKSPIFRPLIAYLAATGMPIPKEQINPYLERVQQIEVRDRSSTSLTIAWNKPDVAPAGWNIEMASWASLPSGEIIKAWTPYKAWEPVNLGERLVGAKLKSLRPASQIEVRIMGVDRDGKFSEPSIFAMTTAAVWRMPSWIWHVSLGLVLVVILVGLYSIREGYWDPQWSPLRRMLRL